MSLKTIRLLSFLGIFFFQKNVARAQTYKYELGLHVGGYVYQGDLSPQRLGSFKTIRPGIGVSFGKPLSNLFSVKGIFNLASLRGDEAKYSEPEYRQHRAFAFKTSLKELGVHLQYNILGNREYWPTVEPYVFAGVSAAFINTRRDAGAFDAAYFSEAESTIIQSGLSADNEQSSRRTVLNLPVGVGFRFNLNSNWAISTESNFRFGGSDYIDGFSQSVNPLKKDHFFSQNVGVNYRLGRGKNGSKLGCPSVN